MTAPKWLDLKVSLGNILSIVTILIGLTAGYFSTVGAVDRNTANIGGLDRRVTKIETTDEQAMRDGNAERIMLNTILTQLQSDMRYLREAMEDLKRQQARQPAPLGPDT